MQRIFQHQQAASPSRMTPSLLRVAAVVLIGAAGCQSSNVDSTTGLRITAAWSGQIDQLEYG